MSDSEHSPSTAAQAADDSANDTADKTVDAVADQVVDARRREMAVEHILFGALRFLAQRQPELLDELDGSLDHLWDKSEGETRDDEAVREVARRFIRSLRNER